MTKEELEGKNLPFARKTEWKENKETKVTKKNSKREEKMPIGRKKRAIRNAGGGVYTNAPSRNKTCVGPRTFSRSHLPDGAMETKSQQTLGDPCDKIQL